MSCYEFWWFEGSVCLLHRMRELSTSKVGTLLRVTGQVVRTHPVHPELTMATFLCLECQTSIPDVEQQFKFTQPTVCKNPMCQNRRRFMLDINNSRFVDFQKVRIQETQKEVPRGIPRRCCMQVQCPQELTRFFFAPVWK